MDVARSGDHDATPASTDKVDFSKVDEIGWTDLMPGSGHGDGGYTDMGWIEVYGDKVPRK